MKSKYKIGDLVGLNNLLLVVGIKPYPDFKYKVECQVCKNDKELHGEAIYEVSSAYIGVGKLPCGCSKTTKWSKQQWEVLVKRKAKENNHIFNGFIESSIFGQNTKLDLTCSNCQNSWRSCSISNYIRNRNCPECAKITRAEKRTTPDELFIFRFRKTGVFPEDQYSFHRIQKTGRLWNVTCNTCDKTFVSDRSNLVVGKVPCDCNSGGGYDIRKDGYFYILQVKVGNSICIKFGISNFPSRRLTDHKRNISKAGGEILKCEMYIGNGKEVLSIESKLKREISLDFKDIEGFRKESCSLEFYPEILSRIKNLKSVNF